MKENNTKEEKGENNIQDQLTDHQEKEREEFKRRLMYPRQYFDSAEYNESKAKGIDTAAIVSREPIYKSEQRMALLRSKELDTSNEKPNYLMECNDESESEYSEDSMSESTK